MVRTRHGAGAGGCLVKLALLGVALYVGLSFGAVYLRFYRYQDAMKQHVRLAANNTNASIRHSLVATADSLKLPPEAREVFIDRRAGYITILAEYSEHVDLRVYQRDIKFRPSAEGTF